ncbi:MAG: hypothetical protein E7056_03780 [Lentisphaerae bacterium]|nr:hypothetical protein [Lentisphaerota bacterium]
MIPSDHFVKFYSEVFKYLQKRGQAAVDEYYSTIAEHQKTHCLKLFQEKGLTGMKEYWDHIIFEENCDADAILEDGKSYTFYMHGCPSLGKVLDNDAGVCDIYCMHCPGWVLPVMSAAGYYCVYDLVRKDIPRCILKAFKHLEDAQKYLEVVKKRHLNDPEMVVCNF